MPRSYTLPSSIGADLKALREQSVLNQKQVERGSGLDQSRISRIEKGEVTPSEVEVNTYLGALRPALARKYKEYLRTEWQHFAQPPFLHPDLEALVKAEKCLREIDSAFPEEDDVENSSTHAVALQRRLFDQHWSIRASQPIPYGALRNVCSVAAMDTEIELRTNSLHGSSMRLSRSFMIPLRSESARPGGSK
jgi:transcriptional regulator with XRE-family HTH domain